MDTENNVNLEVAPQPVDAQSEPVVGTETPTYSPDTTSSEKEEPLLGKFKSTEDLVKSYQELESTHTQTAQRLREAETYLRGMTAPAAAPAPQENWYDETGINPNLLENKIASTSQAQARQAYLDLEAQRFAVKHRDTLTNDPILRATVLDLEREELRQTGVVDYEGLLVKANDLLESRFKTRETRVKAEAEKDGEQLARDKGRATTVSQTTKAAAPDFSKMSAAELKQYYVENNIPLFQAAQSRD